MNITPSPFINLSVWFEEASTDGRTTRARICSRSIQISGLKLANGSNWHRLTQQSESGSELDTTQTPHYYICRYVWKQSEWQLLVHNCKKSVEMDQWVQFDTWLSASGVDWPVWHSVKVQNGFHDQGRTGHFENRNFSRWAANVRGRNGRLGRETYVL